MSPTLPKSYKAAVFERKDGRPVLKDVELQLPGKGQILVKVLACGICHSDEGVRVGGLGDVFPRVPGHEIVGDVVAVGQDVVRFKEGERVGGAWHGGTKLFLRFDGATFSTLFLVGDAFVTFSFASPSWIILTCIIGFLQAMTESVDRASAVSFKRVSQSR